MPRGQALVEFAMVVPILLALLLGTAALGVYGLASAQQSAATATVARWVAEHPTEDPEAFALSAGACPGGTTVAIDGHLVTVTVTCPSVAGELLPVLPSTVTTTATAYTEG